MSSSSSSSLSPPNMRILINIFIGFLAFYATLSILSYLPSRNTKQKVTLGVTTGGVDDLDLKLSVIEDEKKKNYNEIIDAIDGINGSITSLSTSYYSSLNAGDSIDDNTIDSNELLNEGEGDGEAVDMNDVGVQIIKDTPNDFSFYAGKILKPHFFSSVGDDKGEGEGVGDYVPYLLRYGGMDGLGSFISSSSVDNGVDVDDIKYEQTYSKGPLTDLIAAAYDDVVSNYVPLDDNNEMEIDNHINAEIRMEKGNETTNDLECIKHRQDLTNVIASSLTLEFIE